VTDGGRTVGPGEVSFIRQVTESHRERGRSAISRELCRLWDWRQPNGHLMAMVWRGLLLKLERAGHVRLAPEARTGSVAPSNAGTSTPWRTPPLPSSTASKPVPPRRFPTHPLPSAGQLLFLTIALSRS